MGHVHLRKRVNCSVAFAQGNVGKTKHHSALSLDSKMINNGAAVASSRRCFTSPTLISLAVGSIHCSAIGSDIRVGAPFLEVVGANSESGLLHLLKSNMIHIPELSNA